MSTDNLCPMPAVHTGKPEISMAPLVDIVFLLLIFFMVTTVFPENDGLLIEKPSSENAAALNNEQLIIKLDRHGIAYMEEQPVTSDDIKRLLKDELAVKPQLAITIHADHRATTASLIDVLDAAKSAGAKQLGIATDEKRG
ncbi:MAG: biopolymer transporter ExbD [Gammaproteobacteria bacterium]|nr:biopolymer transporter ExbD [Gammaproteobacteria bacterium]